MAGGNGQDIELNQLKHPLGVRVDTDHNLYIAGGHGEGNSLEQLSNPYGIFVDDVGSVYVADCSNHRIMR